MRHPRAIAAALVPLLALAAPAPALAAAPAPPSAVAPVAAPAAASPAAAPVVGGVAGAVAAAPVAPNGGLETDRRTRPVAPGVTLTSFDRIDAAGWLRGDALTAELGGGTRADYVYSGAVSRPEPLSGQVARAPRVVAAVNGDFFDINNSGAAQGIGIQTGRLIQSPVRGHNLAAGVTPDGVGRVVQVYFDGAATESGAAPIGLTQFNNMVQPGGVGAFTALWGEYPRTRAVEGAARVAEVTVAGGVVTGVSGTAGGGPIPAGTTVLLGRDAGADALGSLAVGDRVDVAYHPKADGDAALSAAVGGSHVLVRAGQPQPIADPTLAPRTAVGFAANGRTMYLLTVDGRQADSRGVSLAELARMMVELGAADALNLDGGGSSTLLAREPGSAAVAVQNQPSDGSERPVPNGLAILAAPGSGRLAGFWVDTAMDPAGAPGVAPVAGGRPDRVFPGLTRRLTAAGYDETYGPAAGTPRWSASGGVVSRDGVFRAYTPGVATVRAQHDRARGEKQLTVLNPLRQLATTTTRVALRGADDSAGFGVVGLDGEGSSAPIEPADVRLEYDTALFTVAPAADGTFTVHGRQARAAGLVTVRVGGHRTQVAVTVGLDDQLVAGFDDASMWTFSAARATGSVAPAPGHTGGGLAMSYDFSRDTATRAAYANPPALVDIPGAPLGFTMWVNAAGKGEWPSLHLVDGRGQDLVLRGPYLTWTGWKQIAFTVPPGTVYPLKLRRFYTAETKGDAQYPSAITIDDIVAQVPPPVPAPAAGPAPADPLVVTDGTVPPSSAPGPGGAAAPWRFAVLSDAQFVGRDPDSEIVRNARRALREIRAAAPDFLLIDGDLVDEGRPEDLALAKRILDEELGGALPYYYVPGNHEVMGGSIDNFRAAFGDPYLVFDHRGTRFITLDTSRLTIRGGGFDQLALLRRALDEAAADPAIGSVVLAEHVPPRDPTPAQASQLTDRKEAALVEAWLGDFSARTGKGALAVTGHVGLFHAAHVDGVPYLINGNSGKTPSAAPEDGGFWGWTMLGVDPVTPAESAWARRDPRVTAPPWVTAETRVRVDALTLSAPATVRVGGSATVTATVSQAGRQVPVRFPVSADWSGSVGLFVGPASGLRPWHRAWYDPAIGRLAALRAGTPVTLAVTVNGVTTRATVALTRE